MELLGTLIALIILGWLWYSAYHTFIASWYPDRASARYLARVNGLGARFQPVFKWTSPILLASFSLLALLNVARLLLAAWQHVAS